MSFYKTKYKYADGRSKSQHECISCKGISIKISKQDAQKQYDFILNKTVKSVYKYYLVTLLDDKFNEFTGTICARLYYEIGQEMFGIEDFEINDERIFYEANISEMSANEYYSIHGERNDKEISCPNLTVISTTTKKNLKGILTEYMTALYFYHNKC